MRLNEEATFRLLVEQLKRMSNSQFLSYMAIMMGDDPEHPMAAYVSKRLDLIAMTLEADEAREASDDR